MSVFPNPDPKIYDVVELPESEQGGACPQCVRDGSAPIVGRVEFVFVYERSVALSDDGRKNCVCCRDCKPTPVRADGSGGPSDDTERCVVCDKPRDEFRRTVIIGELTVNDVNHQREQDGEGPICGAHDCKMEVSGELLDRYSTLSPAARFGGPGWQEL